VPQVVAVRDETGPTLSLNPSRPAYPTNSAQTSSFARYSSSSWTLAGLTLNFVPLGRFSPVSRRRVTRESAQSEQKYCETGVSELFQTFTGRLDPHGRLSPPRSVHSKYWDGVTTRERIAGDSAAKWKTSIYQRDEIPSLDFCRRDAVVGLTLTVGWHAGERPFGSRWTLPS